MRAALIAVASAPPKRFAGGGYREAMKGEMTGWFELRVDGPGRHHYRLFCLLHYEAQGVDKPLLVVIDGRNKPFRTTLSNADYAAVRRQKAPDRRRLLSGSLEPVQPSTARQPHGRHRWRSPCAEDFRARAARPADGGTAAWVAAG